MKYLILLFLLYGCSSDNSCGWGYGCLNGKKYKLSKFYYNDKDATSSIGACYMRNLLFQEGFYTFEYDKNCTNTDTVEYNAYSTNGQNYYNEAGVIYHVSAYSCQSFTFTKTINGNRYDFVFVRQ